MIRAADYVSLRWSEEKSLGGRACYKHLAPNGAKSNNNLLHSKLNSRDPIDKHTIYPSRGSGDSKFASSVASFTPFPQTLPPAIAGLCYFPLRAPGVPLCSTPGFMLPPAQRVKKSLSFNIQTHCQPPPSAL
jgi:hypothetical protein